MLLYEIFYGTFCHDFEISICQYKSWLSCLRNEMNVIIEDGFQRKVFLRIVLYLFNLLQWVMIGFFVNVHFFYFSSNKVPGVEFFQIFQSLFNSFIDGVFICIESNIAQLQLWTREEQWCLNIHLMILLLDVFWLH